jgi:cytochrome c oxidase accessory protein FixG
MLDEQSLIVTYQRWRGEPRGHGKRDPAHPGSVRLGDCVDCNACVHACPTGIDIRDGVQLECINCGLCVDACNEIMVKTGQPKWLVTWDTLARQKAKGAGQHERLRLLRPRTAIYMAALAIAISAMATALAIRPHEQLSVQHDRAPLFVVARDGALHNAYTIKISNKTLDAADFTLRISGLADGAMRVSDSDSPLTGQLTLPVAADSIGAFRVLVSGRPAGLVDGSQALTFTLDNSRTGERAAYRSVFMGPEKKPAP